VYANTAVAKLASYLQYSISIRVTLS